MAEPRQDVDLGPLEAALLKLMRREREADTSKATEDIVDADDDDADESSYCYQKSNF